MLVKGRLKDGSEVEVDITDKTLDDLREKVEKLYIKSYLLYKDIFKTFTDEEQEKFVNLVFGLKEKYNAYTDEENENDAINTALHDPAFQKYYCKWYGYKEEVAE